MAEVPNDVAVAQDSHAGGAVLDPLDWDKAMVAGLAQDQGRVCAPAGQAVGGPGDR